MTGDAAGELRRARLVVDNLAARVGALTAENLDLLARLYEYEHADDPAELGDEAGP